MKSKKIISGLDVLKFFMAFLIVGECKLNCVKLQ